MTQRKFAPDRQLSDVTFVVLDLETSGASARTGSAITEIGAVKVCGGNVKGTFHTLINPSTPLSRLSSTRYCKTGPTCPHKR